MSAFRHLDGMVALLSEIYEINERILTGDICSNKTAIASGRMKKLLHHYHEALHEDGAVKVSLQAYAAAGGWSASSTPTSSTASRSPDHKSRDAYEPT